MGNRFNVKLSTFFIILILSSSVMVLSRPHNTLDQQPTPLLIEQSGLVTREKIYINSNDDFQEFPGSGTKEDPYIIAGFEISSPVSDDYDLIKIEGTDVYFIIENNILTGNDQNSGSGIIIVSALNGLVRYNEVRDNSNWGILIAGSEDIIVEHNLVFSNMHQGLELLSSNNNIIRHNTISNNQIHGIASYFSEKNDIINNTVSFNSQGGIHVEEGISHIINRNLVDSNNGVGIWLGGAISNIIELNEISSNSAGIMFRDQTQLGNNPSDDNYILNNLIFDNTRGITSSNGSNNTFSGNLIHGNDGHGFDFNGGENNIITNNIISNNEYGYRSTGSVIQNVINCNIFDFNRGYGVFIDKNPEYEIIVRNDFLNNQNKPQANDNGFSNKFEYNYWDEIGNQDQNNDGINDIQYLISGDANNADSLSIPIRNMGQSNVNLDCNFGLNLATGYLNSQNAIKPELKFPVSNSLFIIFPVLIIFGISIAILFRRKSDF
ncbi:MAG: hypothetical protein HeimC2_09600 [Candidatus Heimdallarchaeota archaeon LC_2]|nr:MAG: hypothetical protein HeimC2_09600 [Candidatus Heimdallarchaeota archaeon LC_2]